MKFRLSRFKSLLDFFRKNKIPKGEKYPYNTCECYEVFDREKTGYEKLYLVGDNWLKSREKPIALLFGINDWKLGFISDYLKDFRCAFAPRNMRGFRAIITVLKLRVKPSQFFIWGYNDDRLLSLFLDSKKVCRLEDGFIRSASLGANHSTPYSLAFDRKGLYYNATKQSELEDILNNYDFKNDHKLLQKARIALNTLLKYDLSKYSMPILYKDASIKLKKRIAVFGQVDKDASLKYGNLLKITSEEMLLIAKKENPGAEIIYRPHPEVYAGFQKSKLKTEKIKDIATLAPPNEDVVELIKRVDHIYTITSLTGFEALLRGKKVTVMGAPFYSGWGLTDDRVKIKRRNSKLSILELFAGAYLLYPKYLANLNDSFEGFMAACFRITADRSIEEYNFFNKKHNAREYSTIASSKFFVKSFFLGDYDFISNNFDKIKFGYYVLGKTPALFEKIYLLAIIGKLKNERFENMFLNKVRGMVRPEVFHDILVILNQNFEKKYLVNQILWLKSNSTNIDLDSNLASIVDESNPLTNRSRVSSPYDKCSLFSLKKESLSSEIKILLEKKDYSKLNELIKLASRSEILSDKLSEEKMQSFYDFFMREKEFDTAFSIAETMLLNNVNTVKVLLDLVVYAKLRFDFSTVKKLAELNQNMSLFAVNRNMSSLEIDAYSLEDFNSIGSTNFNIKLSKVIVLKPGASGAFTIADLIISKYYGTSSINYNNIFKSLLILDNDQTIQKSQAFNSISRSDLAVSVMENIIAKGSYNINTLIAYSQALSFNDQVDLAIYHVENGLRNHDNRNLYAEAIRLYVLKGNYRKALYVIKESEKRNILLGEMHLRKTYFGNKMIFEAFQTFKEIRLKKVVEKHYGQKYLDDLNNIGSKKLVVLSLYGPGDEIRFASIYNDIVSSNPNTEIFISCSPKLFDLFQRSFKFLKVKFIPTIRLRSTEDIDIKKFNNLKSSELVQIMDNQTSDLIDKSDNVVLLTDFLSMYLKDYNYFKGESYLQVDLRRKRYYKSLLPKNKKLVGLSWRSSLSTHSRNEHYLSVEVLDKIFSIENIQFVNLQYDECSKELAWIEERYPGKILNIAELDQLNDLDGVAALMTCMDLVISPATTVVELAGALGCNTWLFSNSSEIDWRKIDGNVDVWHNSVRIIDANQKGNKELLIEQLYNNLLEYSER